MRGAGADVQHGGGMIRDYLTFECLTGGYQDILRLSEGNGGAAQTVTFEIFEIDVGRQRFVQDSTFFRSNAIPCNGKSEG